MPEFLISDPNDTVLEITVFDSDLFSPNGKNTVYFLVFCFAILFLPSFVSPLRLFLFTFIHKPCTYLP